MICKHWYELDGEYCGARHMACACAGTKAQCEYPRYFNAGPVKIKRLLQEESMKRAMAMCEGRTG